jgi:crossover junction endodeoxyribonuclease RuvC
MSIYLGIDPGYGRVGWGVIQAGSNLKCLGYGCIETTTGAALQERYFQIEKKIKKVIEDFRPMAAGVELLYWGRNVSTGMRVSEARGVILLTLYRAGLDILEPTPNQVKAEVSSGKAGKKEIQRMTKVLLGLRKLPRPDDAADALAVALFVESQSRLHNLAIDSYI